MPQIAPIKRQPLVDGTTPITDKGDLCFLITKLVIIPTWTEKPRWDTVSVLHTELVQDPDMPRLKSICRGSPFSDAEIKNQAALAFMEFYRRVAANYENANARKYGDVYANVTYSNSAQIMKGA